MKNLQLIAEQCLKELDFIGIKYGNIVSFEVNSRAKKRWGQCKYTTLTDTYRIQVSNRLLEDYVPEKSVKQVIIHEILHTCKGCLNHGKTWKRYAELVNETYGYDISRTASASALGVNTDQINIKHQFVCKNCGKVINRMRESKFTKNYQHYSCGRCGGDFEKIF